MYRSTRKNNIALLFDTQKNIFTSSDLAVIWGISNKNTLWTTLKRYSQKKVLFRIKQGLYSKIKLNNLSDFELGCALAGSFSYISLETVLEIYGAIMQKVKVVTVAGTKNANFKIEGREFSVRKTNLSYLVNRIGIEEKNGYAVASLSRAVCDIQFFNPKYYFDNERAVNWVEVKKFKSLLN